MVLQIACLLSMCYAQLTFAATEYNNNSPKYVKECFDLIPRGHIPRGLPR